MKHLLKLADLDKGDILDILNLADQLKYENQHGIEHHHLKGKTLGMIFQKALPAPGSALRPACTSWAAGTVPFNRDLQIGRGEPIQDTARVLSRYLDGIMIRTFAQKEVEDLAEYGSIPIINGLTDYCHPCQVLADLMTIREYKKSFDGLKFCFIGDGNNMANSLIVGAISMGMECAIACPKDYQPDAKIMAWAKENGTFTCSEDILACAKDADVVYTDVWASMGQEEEKAEREKIFKNYQINDEVMAAAKPDAMVLHCLPAHREEEITAKVFEAHANEIFDEAENRLHAQKAVLVKLLG